MMHEYTQQRYSWTGLMDWGEEPNFTRAFLLSKWHIFAAQGAEIFFKNSSFQKNVLSKSNKK